MTDLPLCACGCGFKVDKKNKKYYKDHFRNPPNKNETIEYPKIINFKKEVPKENILKKSNTKTNSKSLNKTTPIPDGKISIENLKNAGLWMWL